MANALKKAVAGAAEAGAQLSLEQIKSDMLAKRDQKLHEHRMARQQDEQQFSASQSQQSRQFQASQNQEQRQFQAEQSAADRELTEEQLSMEGERLEMQQQINEKELAQLDQAIREGKLGLVQTQQAQQLRSTIIDPEASAQEQAQAARSLRQIMGNAQQREYEFQTVGGGEFGDQETPYAFDPLTGTASEINTGNSNIPQGAIEMLRSDPSDQAIQEFDQKYGSGSARRVLNQ